jgi:glutathione S-transferase
MIAMAFQSSKGNVMLKIYGVYQSRASRVYWMAEELGLAFQSVPVIQSRFVADPEQDGARLNTRSAAYLAVNPAGLIPAIEDEGLMLTESLAITHYLAEKHGGPVGPQSAQEKGEMLAWTLWAATSVEPQTIKIVLTHDAGQQTSPGSVEAIGVATRLLKGPLSRLNTHLSTHDYLVGDRFTVADLNVCEIIRYAMGETAFMAGFPAILDWVARCHCRPAFQRMWQVRSAEGG